MRALWAAGRYPRPAVSPIELVGLIVVVLALIPVVWLKARIVRSGELAQEWGLPEDDDARAEIERIFPGATKPSPKDEPRGGDRALSDSGDAASGFRGA